MARRKGVSEDRFTDVHMVRSGIDRRLRQLMGDGPVGDMPDLGRPERDAIIEFVKSRRGEVGEHRERISRAYSIS